MRELGIDVDRVLEAEFAVAKLSGREGRLTYKGVVQVPNALLEKYGL